MAQQSGTIRRGLPRVRGGEPWPPAAEVPASAVASAPVVAAPAVELSAPVVPPPAASAAAQPAPSDFAVSPQLRRGLPRVPGAAPQSHGRDAGAKTATTAGFLGAAPVAVSSDLVPAAHDAVPPASGKGEEGGLGLRRGLPRVVGGDAWPAAGYAPANPAAAGPGPVQAAVKLASPAVNMADGSAPSRAVAERGGHLSEDAPDVNLVREAKPPRAADARSSDVTQPSATAEKKPRLEAKLYGSRTLGQWGKLLSLGAVGAIAAAALLVLAARGVTTLPGVPEFLEEFPGEYSLPESAEPGFPWWAQWTHFLNIFLMVLIIRSGYQVRTQQKPPAFWTPKRGGKKISIYLWLHQALDILWLSNGLVFVVLLFASGHWMRIVPSSWEVFPNALSALLQYMTLEWPVENGWVNYNSLQQLMYFIVVFIAAPLAALTGVRMSELWPKNAKVLNKIYPVEAARAVHFPTMLFFVLFILIHVFLVLSTGALRNLNHMFGGTDVVNWTGFWLFAAAIAITAGAWFAARPLILAPIAKRFGQVGSR